MTHIIDTARMLFKIMVKYTSNEQEILNLKGAVIDEWLICEMALFEDGDLGYPEFEHPDCPFIQAQVIQMRLSNGRFVGVSTYQDNDIFGILVEQSPQPRLVYEPFVDDKSIYRFSNVSKLPLGLIEDVSVARDKEHNVTEILLSISSQKVTLKAGEVYEEDNNRYQIKECDESVLLFRQEQVPGVVRFDQVLTR